MAQPILTIGGTDYSSLLMEGAIKWSRNDLDSEDSGRTLDGVFHRARVAIKRKLSISTLKRLTTAEISQLNTSLMPQTVSVVFLDAITGAQYTGTFYGSSVEATTMVYDPINQETYWEDISFSLIEV